MMEQFRGLNQLTENSSLSYSSVVFDQCKQLVPVVSNKTAVSNNQSSLPNYFRQFLIKENLTLNSFTSLSECINTITRIINNINESNITIKTNRQKYDIHDPSRSLIVFVILIGFVSLISIIGNLCLAKVLYSKRYRLIQTDRIVLCLALSELCLVLIDSPTEIYRFLSQSFTLEWLCRFHTFFEALFSSCIIFYHLLGAFDRFVYIHGHTSSNKSSWSKWCHRISTKSGSIILLILPIICSLPLAICNCLHANIMYTSLTNKTCVVKYTHGILIGLLISFYILPLLFSFFLHAKLIYFIRTRHNQHYLTTIAYILPMKRNNTIEVQSRRRANKENTKPHNRLLLQSKRSSHRRLIMTNTEILGSTTTTGAAQSTHLNNSSNSSQSSRSSTGTSSTSIAYPVILYKINSQANANANRTVLLLVLLLSFYVFCWAPYNIYTWRYAYQLTQSSSSSLNRANLTSFNDSNPELPTSIINNLNADLRRFIYINYSLYLLSMVSMCFSFIFYFSLNKQARHEFSRFIGCICPWIIHIRNEKQRQKYPKQSKQLQYHTRFQNYYSYKNDRIKKSPPSLLHNRYNHINYPQNRTTKRTVLNYGCHVQCCP